MTTRETAQRILHLGVDPGFSGAVAIIDETGGVVGLYDTPILSLRASRGTRHEYDLPGMVRLLQPYAGHNAHVIIEQSQAMPNQGVRSMFTIGLGYGAWLALLAALELPYTQVRPARWKHALGLRGKDKEAARLRAQQLFPGADLRLKKHHGRAEGLLLASYGRTRSEHVTPVG